MRPLIMQLGKHLNLLLSKQCNCAVRLVVLFLCEFQCCERLLHNLLADDSEHKFMKIYIKKIQHERDLETQRFKRCLIESELPAERSES